MVIFVSAFGLAAGSLFGQTASPTPKIAADAARCFQIDQEVADLTAQMRAGALTAAVRKQRAEALTTERARIVAGYGARSTPEHRALLAEIARLKAEVAAVERAERAEATRLAREKTAAEQAARREDAKAERLRAEKATADALQADVTAVVEQQLLQERDRFYADMGVKVRTDSSQDQRIILEAQTARSRRVAGGGKLEPAFERKINDTYRQRLPAQRKQWFVAALPSPEQVVSPFSSQREQAAALTAAERLLEFHVPLPRSNEATAKLESYRTARARLGVERSEFSSLADDRAFQAQVFAQSLPHHSQRLLADLERERAQLRSAVAYGVIMFGYVVLFLWLPFRWGRRSVAYAKEIRQAPLPSPELPGDLQWVELPGMRYPVQLTSGLVFDKEVWTETRVTTTTTTTPAPSGSPPFTPPHTSTSRHVSSTVYHRYWIVTPKGEQLSQRYTDSEFLATPGQRISSLACGNSRLLAYNHESRVIAFPPEWTKGFHRPRYWPQVGGLVLLGVVAVSVSGLASAWALGVVGVPPAYFAGPMIGASVVSSLFFSLIYVAMVNAWITRRRQRHFRKVLVPRYQAFLASHQPVIPSSVQRSDKKGA